MWNTHERESLSLLAADVDVPMEGHFGLLRYEVRTHK